MAFYTRTHQHSLSHTLTLTLSLCLVPFLFTVALTLRLSLALSCSLSPPLSLSLSLSRPFSFFLYLCPTPPPLSPSLFSSLCLSFFVWASLSLVLPLCARAHTHRAQVYNSGTTHTGIADMHTPTFHLTATRVFRGLLLHFPASLHMHDTRWCIIHVYMCLCV